MISLDTTDRDRPGRHAAGRLRRAERAHARRAARGDGRGLRHIDLQRPDGGGHAAHRPEDRRQRADAAVQRGHDLRPQSGRDAVRPPHPL